MNAASAPRRVKPIRQAEAAECGVAALAMVANSWGHDLDLAAARRRFGASARGTGLRSLMEAADALGLAPRAVKVELEGISDLHLPAILHWDMDHFVVLERVSRGRFYVVDPAGDARWHDPPSFSKHFTGVALELRPSPGFRAERELGGLRIRDLRPRDLGLGRALSQAAVLSLVLQAYVLASPWLLQLSVDHALANGDARLVTILALGFALFALIYAGAGMLRALVLLRAGTALAFGIASNVARRLVRLPVDWFQKRSVGDVLSRFQSVQPIQRLLTERAAAALIDGVLALLTLAMMLAYSPLLTLIPLASLLTYAAVRAATLKAERRAENDRIAAAGREQSALIETLRGIVTVRLAGRETVRHASWQNRLAEALGAGFRHDRIQLWQGSAATLLAALEVIALVWAAVTMSIAGELTVGMIFAFLAYRMQFAAAATSLVDTATEVRMLRLHLERLSDIALTAEDRGFAEPAAAKAPLEGRIELRGVSFAYAPDEPRVLNGVGLDVAAGEHVAITGPSGGGKTTLARILLGLLDPDEGEVLVDGLPLAAYGRRAFREQVGAVLQDDVLFAGTIAENVAGFEPVDEERLAEALEMAAIAGDIEAMPMRQLTLVGDMGSTLSGGQLQRILLARALYRRPRLLVMDEGTAHLDPEHERKVNEAIAALGITRIVFAHRRETLAAADRVLTLTEGHLSAE
jgi:ATP-binding cassette subfamily B protein RaxB